LIGVLLPRVLEFDRPSARERIEALALAVHSPDDRAPVPFEVRLARLFENVRAPASLEVAGMDRALLDAARGRIVANTLRSPAVLANPRVPGERDIESLLMGTPSRPAPES
jgi:alcohol dehydrogenase class IV